jgi:hypothetical protein
MSAGEQAVVLLLAVDRKQAAILRRYCEGLCALCCWRRKWCVRPAIGVEFRNGATLEIATNAAVPGCQGMDRAETEGKERREKSAGTQRGCELDDGRTL